MHHPPALAYLFLASGLLMACTGRADDGIGMSRDGQPQTGIGKPAPLATSADDTSAACDNPALYRAGSRWRRTMRDDNGLWEHELVSEVIGPTTFRGQAVVETRTSGPDWTTSNYRRLQPDTLEAHGSQTGSPGEASQRHYYDPVIRYPRAQVKGETLTLKYALRGMIGELQREETATLTYEGRETIRVPAGKFETCRFRETSNSAGLGNQWHDWFIASGPYRGLHIKQVSYDDEGRISGGYQVTRISADFR